MALRLQSHPLLSQNARVNGMGLGSDETSHLPTAEKRLSRSTMDTLIEGAYRQLFFHTFKADRNLTLESQLRSGQITVKEFVRGLVLSGRFLDGVYSCNGNKQVARQLIERVLGRQIHGEAEAIAWSIVIGEQGVATMVDQLLASHEYSSNFGSDTVPFQRQRVLPGRRLGNQPLNITLPRYGDHHRQVIASFPPSQSGGFQVSGSLPPARVQKLWYGLILVGGFEVLRVVISIVGAMLATGSN
ncbi:MAG: phycobilisome rod-core linker polypeptide [Cyanobacteria bacterium]|nr:phycobilisome rod-core linker polypeptide [Cyanobacteriota bacterium]